MAKEKIPSTPETRAKKLADKKEVSKAFSKTFFAALAVCLSVLLIYSVCYISFFRPKEQTIEGNISNNTSNTVNTNTVINNGGSSNSSSTDNGGSAAPADNGGSSATPADNGGSAAPADNGGAAAPADNSVESILNEFNTAINKVKSEGTITHVSGGTLNNGGVDPSSQLPSLIKSLAGGIIDAAMSSNGVKEDGSVIDASKFPVENTGYSSQLTMDDIVSATKSGNTITIVIKDDELGEADNGHCAKAMNVIKASTIMDNIPSAVTRIVSVTGAKTSAKNGKIVVELDGNGHVTKADYTFDWDIEILGNNLDAIIHLATEEHYSIAY